MGKSLNMTIDNNNIVRDGTSRGDMMLPAMVGLAVISMAFSPLIVPAFAAKTLDQASVFVSDWSTQFTPAGVDSRLAELQQNRLSGQENDAVKISDIFRFTPAGLDKISNRTLTVAARTHTESADAVNVREIIAKDSGLNASAAQKLAALKTTKYSLKQDKGWKGFELSALPKISSSDRLGRLNRISVPSIDFKLSEDKDQKPSKFSTSMKIAQDSKAAPSPLGNAAGEDYVLNLGGSFSISKRIDLTAGVRYDRQNDIPLSSADKREDSEAVYVGTKIRF